MKCLVKLKTYITYILSPAEDALVSAIIFLTFSSSRLNFTVTSSDSGPCSGMV